MYNIYKGKINAILEQADWWFHKEGNYNEAKKYYSQIISFMSDKSLEVKKAVSFELAKAYYGVGKCYSRLENDEKAVTNYNIAIKCNPQVSLDAYLVVGAEHIINEENDCALRIYNKALKIYPNAAKLYSERGKVYVRFLKNLVADVKGEGKKSYYNSTGNLFLSDYSHTEKDFMRRYIKNNLNFVRVSYYVNSALKDCHKAIFFDKKRSGEIYMYISDIHFYVLNYSKAIETCKIVIKNSSDPSIRCEVHAKLCWLYMYHIKNNMEAIRHFKEAEKCGLGTLLFSVDITDMYDSGGCYINLDIIRFAVAALKKKIFQKNIKKW